MPPSWPTRFDDDPWRPLERGPLSADEEAWMRELGTVVHG
jgi:hypothetical protein